MAEIPGASSNHTGTSSDNWCCTEVKMIKFNYTWIIKNFPLLFWKERDRILTSSSFFIGADDDKQECCLRMKTNNYEDDQNYFSIYLRFSSNNSKIQAKAKFSILNAYGEETYVSDGENVTEYESNDLLLGFKRFIQRNYLLNKSNGLLPDDNLTISCEINFVTEPVNVSGRTFKVPQCELSDNIGTLFQDPMFFDVTINVSGRQHRAHKAILSARSKVFESIFKQTKSNWLEIKDVDSEVFKEMLQFIYTGKVSNLKGMTADLLLAANKYSLERLKLMCEEELCNQLSTENAVEILLLAKRLSANQLKAEAVKFINENIKEVIR